MLLYTLPELAKEFRTSKENVYQLEGLGEIKSIQFSSCKLVSIYEAERFLKENAGRSFVQIIREAKKRKNLQSVSNVVNIKEA